jgi:hypothetical protein
MGSVGSHVCGPTLVASQIRCSAGIQIALSSSVDIASGSSRLRCAHVACSGRDWLLRRARSVTHAGRRGHFRGRRRTFDGLLYEALGEVGVIDRDLRIEVERRCQVQWIRADREGLLEHAVGADLLELNSLQPQVPDEVVVGDQARCRPPAPPRSRTATTGLVRHTELVEPRAHQPGGSHSGRIALTPRSNSRRIRVKRIREPASNAFDAQGIQ